MRWIMSLLGTLALVTGCSHPAGQDPAPAPATPPASSAAAPDAAPSAPAPRYPVITPITPVQGRVTLVQEKLRFVIVDFSFHQLPQLGQRLGLHRQNTRVGEVRISGPFRGQTVVADLMAGTAQIGDLVRED